MVKLILPRGLAKESPHIARLKDVARWRMPPEGSPDWVSFRLGSAKAMSDPRYRRRLRDLAREASATAKAVLENGAGLPADTGIREFIRDYNNRSAAYGIHYLPASHNIFNAFSDFSPRLGAFIPLDEINHICNVSGFLDYISSFPKRDGERFLPELTEGKIYCYSFLESPSDWSFDVEDMKFTVSAVSMVRHANEVTVMCLVGMGADLAKESESVKEVLSTSSRNPFKPDLDVDSSLKVEAVPLEGSSDLWRRYVAFRYDIDSGRLQARYSLADMGNSWAIDSDDPLYLDSARELGIDADKQLKKIEKINGVFAFLVRFMRLPEYFSCYGDHVIKDKAVTALSSYGSSIKGKWLEYALRSQVVYERDVINLLEGSPELEGFEFPPFELSVEVEGFWDKLPFGSYGEGPNGERVLGRTWVRRTLSRREARVPGAATRVTKQDVPVLGGGDEGSIYVLRNAAHQIDIFKIGLTRRAAQTRASEISRGTGVPDQFLTVQTWWVPDVVFAEKRIHTILDEYRLRDKREFFRAEYSTIRAAIELVVAELAGRATS